MLHDFLRDQRGQIILRVRQRVTKRRAPLATDDELEIGVPLFLDQLGAALDRTATGVAEISSAASRQGTTLLQSGFTISQVVHGYGDICQVVTGLAIELDAPISNEEFRTLNLCLDEAIAGAVTEFTRLREESIAGQGTERLGFLAHEIRNLLGGALMAFHMLRDGTVPIAGSTGAILGRSLSRLTSLVDRALAEVRLESGLDHHDRVPIAEIIEEMEIVAAAQAKVRKVRLEVNHCTPRPMVLGDRHLVGSAIDNLVQNAIKFTPPDGLVKVTTRIEGDRVIIDVEDACGGLPEGEAERLFAPFEQRDKNRSGLGLGLAISRRGVRAMGGEITVQDVPGKGCIFTIRLPLVP